jgi:uncharacterized RDD family membrane protein YckC
MMSGVCVPFLWISEGSRVEPVAWVGALLLYMNKDFWRARSIAKRMLGLQVVDATTGLLATTTQCFIRNVTLLLWPVDALLILLCPTRKAGDYIAGTACVLVTTPTSFAD